MIQLLQRQAQCSERTMVIVGSDQGLVGAVISNGEDPGNGWPERFQTALESVAQSENNNPTVMPRGLTLGLRSGQSLYVRLPNSQKMVRCQAISRGRVRVKIAAPSYVEILREKLVSPLELAKLGEVDGNGVTVSTKVGSRIDLMVVDETQPPLQLRMFVEGGSGTRQFAIACLDPRDLSD